VALPTMNWRREPSFTCRQRSSIAMAEVPAGFQRAGYALCIDARSFQIHASILVSELRLRLGNETTVSGSPTSRC